MLELALVFATPRRPGCKSQDRVGDWKPASTSVKNKPTTPQWDARWLLGGRERFVDGIAGPQSPISRLRLERSGRRGGAVVALRHAGACEPRDAVLGLRAVHS